MAFGLFTKEAPTPNPIFSKCTPGHPCPLVIETYTFAEQRLEPAGSEAEEELPASAHHEAPPREAAESLSPQVR